MCNMCAKHFFLVDLVSEIPPYYFFFEEQNATLSLLDNITKALWKNYAKFNGDDVERISVFFKRTNFLK